MTSPLLDSFLEPRWKGASDFLSAYKNEFESMKAVHKSLADTMEELKDYLTSVIHNNYSTFVMISCNLHRLGENLNSTIQLISNVEKSILEETEKLKNSTIPFKQQKEKLEFIRREKAVSAMAIDAINYLEETDKVLKDPRDEYVYLDIAISLAAVKGLLTGISESPLHKPIFNEFQRQLKEFGNLMSISLVNAVTSHSEDKLTVIIHASKLINMRDIMHASIKKHFIDPILRFEASNESSNFNQLLDTVLKVFNNDNIRYIISFYPEYCHLYLWPTVIDYLDANLEAGAGERYDQIKSYHAWKRFESVVETNARSTNEIAQIAKLASIVEKKLALGIYSVLVTKDFEAMTDAALASASPIHEVISLLQKIIDPEVFVVEETKQFAKLFVNILFKYRDHCLNTTKNRPSVILDLRKLSKESITISTDLMRPAVHLACLQLEKTASELEMQEASSIAEQCINVLAYIPTVKPTPASTGRSASEIASEIMRPYISWEKEVGGTLSSPAILEHVATQVLDKFKELAESNLSNLQSKQNTLLGIGTSLYNKDINVNSVKNRLSADLNIIESYLRGKGVDVDKIESLAELRKALKPSAIVTLE